MAIEQKQKEIQRKIVSEQFVTIFLNTPECSVKHETTIFLFVRLCWYPCNCKDQQLKRNEIL